MIIVNFIVDYNINLVKLLDDEFKDINWNRHEANYEIKNNQIIITSKSEDSKAMKAGLNAISRLIDIYYSISNIKNE